MNRKRSKKCCRWLIGLNLIVLGGCFTGCTPVKPEPWVNENDSWSPDPVLPAGQYHVVGRSVRGRPLTIQVFGSGPDVTLIVGTIHGNEAAGTELVRYFGGHLERNRHLLQGRTIVLMATANPDGKVAVKRSNARGIDLNRNFPSNNRINNKTNGPGGLSEPEAVAIDQLIRKYRPDRIVTLHQPLACVDYDGPAKDLAERMATHCDLPVKKLGARPGSLGSYAGETLNIPIVTLEMLKNDTWLSDIQLWNRYGSSLLAAVDSPSAAPDVWRAR
ncbi:M14 family zinc carboxypeptidase [Planctomycetota bacterium]